MRKKPQAGSSLNITSRNQFKIMKVKAKPENKIFGGKKPFIPKGFVALTFNTSKQKHEYMLVDKRGQPLVTSSTMPIYWYKRIAIEQAKRKLCFIKKVYLVDNN